MKGVSTMQDLTTVSSSSSLTTSSSLPTNNLVQPLLAALGWKDLKPAIVAAEQADQALALELQQAYDGYSETPDELSKHRLQLALDQVIGELQSNLTRVQKHQKQAEKRLAKPQTSSSGYLASWGSWIKQSAQSFFGSDDVSLVERYRDIAQQRQAEIAQLSQLRAVLATGSTATQTAVTEDTIEELISPLTQTLQRQTRLHRTALLRTLQNLPPYRASYCKQIPLAQAQRPSPCNIATLMVPVNSVRWVMAIINWAWRCKVKRQTTRVVIPSAVLVILTAMALLTWCWRHLMHPQAGAAVRVRAMWCLAVVMPWRGVMGRWS
jgi:hypothetical protein